MANIKSAKKQALQSEVRRKNNLARKSAIKNVIKKFALALENKVEETKVRELLSDIAAKMYRARGKNVMHANTASRKLSRLTKQANKVYNQEKQAPAA